MNRDPRQEISDLFEGGWEIVGTSSQSSERGSTKDDNDFEWIEHRLILRKENSVICFAVNFNGLDFFDVTKFILAPGKHS
jgi:hypothetical protein